MTADEPNDPRIGVVAKCDLDTEDIADVNVLSDAVRREDGVDLKLNWEPRVPGIPADFCFYDGGRLVGFAPLDGDGDELEVTAAVLPSHRRQGIFRRLLEAACQEARARGAKRLLVVGYRASASSNAGAKALDLRYIESEYRMEAQATSLPPLDAGDVRLVPVDAQDSAALARMRALTFGEKPKSLAALLKEIESPGVRYFLAERHGRQIGQIGVVQYDDDGIYLRSVGIVPELRRRGYGRQLLAATVIAMIAGGYRQFALDVATDNVHALSLYTACGFHATAAYDYYDVPLPSPDSAAPDWKRCRYIR